MFNWIQAAIQLATSTLLPECPACNFWGKGRVCWDPLSLCSVNGACFYSALQKAWWLCWWWLNRRWGCSSDKDDMMFCDDALGATSFHQFLLLVASSKHLQFWQVCCGSIAGALHSFTRRICLLMSLRCQILLLQMESRLPHHTTRGESRWRNFTGVALKK